MNKRSKRVRVGELLAPAGDLERGLAAFRFGADAVFLGAKAYSLRSQASNFFNKDIAYLTTYAHARNKCVYVAVNAICHNALVKGLSRFMGDLVKTQPDALIVADPFIIDYMQQHYPDVELHLSTQQSVTNSAAARFWKNNGISRVVLAREVTIKELTALMCALKNTIEIEYFVHGAVCISYSGRCTMSNNWSLRDANVGGCAQSCRWLFDLSTMDAQTTLSSRFTMSPRDMMLVNDLNKLLDLGVASFKIEGRMRSLNYVTGIVKTYRQAIKRWRTQHKKPTKLMLRDLAEAQNRLVSPAYSRKNPGVEAMLYGHEQQPAQQTFMFVVQKKYKHWLQVEGRNWFEPGQKFVLHGPNYVRRNLTLRGLYDENKKPIAAANVPKRTYYLDFGKPIKEAKKGDIGRLQTVLNKS